ncbi:DUF805 domain-containing protein [Ferrimicrobium sp.]|uniref:DUF805 domain-containing protein n=1 Tax=Ferrimicrobium sp. TaxID=2926050 RepID=UPI00262D6224|nr:DUF805 domain-containing protein [Ferrimicrobium sp.]
MRVVPTTKDVSFKEAYLLYLLRWNDFRGRSSRQEFWKVVAITIVVVFALSRISYALGLGVWIALAYDLLNIVPVCSLQTRRLHDSGHSGWWIAVGVTLNALLLALVFGIAMVAYGSPGVPMLRLAPYLMFGFGILTMAVLVIEIVTFVFDCQRGALDNRYGPQMH